MWVKHLDNPLMYTKEQRKNASAKAITIIAILADIKELETLE